MVPEAAVFPTTQLHALPRVAKLDDDFSRFRDFKTTQTFFDEILGRKKPRRDFARSQKAPFRASCGFLEKSVELDGLLSFWRFFGEKGRSVDLVFKIATASAHFSPSRSTAQSAR
jgi:hypothetical protein